MNKFFVYKETGTFSDTLECLGLADILEVILSRVSEDEDQEVIIEEKNELFLLKSDLSFSQKNLSKINFFDFMPYVTKKNEDVSKLNWYFINYKEQAEIKEKYSKLKKEDREKSEIIPRPDFDIIRLYSNIDSYRKAFTNLKNLKQNFHAFIFYILKYYSNSINKREIVLEELKSSLQKNKIKLEPVNVSQDINPDKGRGANQPKANSVKPKSFKIIWFRQLLRFTGGWSGFISRYYKKDYKNYVIVPSLISSDERKNVFEKFKKSIYGSTIIKTEILMILKLTSNLLVHKKENTDFYGFNPCDSIKGLQYSYYKNLGKRPAVTDIGFLGLPNFINIKNKNDIINWLSLIKEHEKIIGNSEVNENHSSNILMLQYYREFLSGSELKFFFEFYYKYIAFLMRAKTKYLKPFSTTNLELLMSTKSKYQEIYSNKGFIAIAEAIRKSTIEPAIRQKNKEIHFGLSHKIKIASRNKDSFVKEVSDFVQKYNESIMLKDFHDKEHSKYVTTEELIAFLSLLDTWVSSELLASILVAFGYSRNPKI